MAVPTGTIFSLDPSLFASHQIAAANDEATPSLALVENALEALEIAEESRANSSITTGTTGTTCLTCGVSSFTSTEEQRDHFKTDWHKLNVKRRVAGLVSVTEEQFLALIENDEDRDVLGSLSGSDSDTASDSDDGHENDESGPSTTAGPQFIFSSKEGHHFAVWRCLVAPDRERAVDPPLPSECLTALHHLNTEGGRWAIILFRGGHFSAAIFDVRPPKPSKSTTTSSSSALGKYSAAAVDASLSPIAHKSFHKYVVRAKAGGKQSTKDATGKFAKSAGSRLRRHNEAALHQDIEDTLASWRSELEACSLILVAAPGSNGKTLFSLGDPLVLNKSDKRVRKVPFTTRRPTLSEAKRVARVLLTVYDANKAVQQGKSEAQKTAPSAHGAEAVSKEKAQLGKKLPKGDRKEESITSEGLPTGQETAEERITDTAAEEAQREAELREEAARAKKAEKRAKQKQKQKEQRQAEAADKAEAAAAAAKVAAEDEIGRAARQAAALAQRAQAKATAAASLNNSASASGLPKFSAQASAPASASGPVRLSSKPLASEDAATRRARMAAAAEARMKALEEATSKQRLR